METDNFCSQPTFSVVIPLYQKRHRIEACLASVSAQITPAIEVIVVDDGSTDGGGDVVRTIGAGWIRYVYQENRGVSAARNYGISLAQGTYVAFLDADDTWHDDHITTLKRLAEKYPDAPIIGTTWSGTGSNPNPSGASFSEESIDVERFLRDAAGGHPPFWTSAVGIKKSLTNAQPLFPVGSRIAEDQDAWLKLLTIGIGYKANNITAFYHLDTQNSCIAKAKGEDFDSVIFTKWSRSDCYPSKSYSRFVASHRLYTIERHIGHTSNRALLNCLVNTKSTFQPFRRLKILTRIVIDQLSRFFCMRRSDNLHRNTTGRLDL